MRSNDSVKNSSRFVRIFGAPAVVVALMPVCFQASAQTAPNVYVQHNLVSDIPGMADVTDPNLVDPWGIAISAASPFWVSVNGKATLYNGAGTITALVVTVPAGAKGPPEPRFQGRWPTRLRVSSCPAALARRFSSLQRMERFQRTLASPPRQSWWITRRVELSMKAWRWAPAAWVLRSTRPISILAISTSSIPSLRRPHWP